MKLNQITPSTLFTLTPKGYLHLPPTYLASNPKFTLVLPLAPRLISPHPFTNQHIGVLARGPLIYCLEDVDHPWVQDHFQSLVLKPGISIPKVEEVNKKTDLPLGESYIGITLKKSGIIIPQEELAPALEMQNTFRVLAEGKEAVDLHFVPYFARANRGGKGQMRVGIRMLD